MSVHWEAAGPVILQLYTLKLNVLEQPALYTVRLMSFLFDDNIVFMIWAQIHLAFTKSEFKNKGWRNFSCTWRKQKLGNKIFLMTYWNTELMYLIHRKKKKIGWKKSALGAWQAMTSSLCATVSCTGHPSHPWHECDTMCIGYIVCETEVLKSSSVCLNVCVCCGESITEVLELDSALRTQRVCTVTWIMERNKHFSVRTGAISCSKQELNDHKLSLSLKKQSKQTNKKKVLLTNSL